MEYSVKKRGFKKEDIAFVEIFLIMVIAFLFQELKSLISLQDYMTISFWEKIIGILFVLLWKVAL